MISEKRARDTDSNQYAQKIIEQITLLLDAGVPAKNITVVGASKGAGIAAAVSSLMENTNLNFVLLGFCAPGTVEAWIRDQTPLYGNVLAIRDASDDWPGPATNCLLTPQAKVSESTRKLCSRSARGTGSFISLSISGSSPLPSGGWARH